MGFLSRGFITVPVRNKNAYEIPVALDNLMDPAIQLREVVKTYKTPAGEFTALKGINLSFYQGEFVGITGKSGSGKSTLINMITGIDKATSGAVRIGDTMIHDLSESDMSKWRGRHLGIVFQFYQLLPMLSLLENVMLPMDFCEMYDPAYRETRALRLLEQVGLKAQAEKTPAEVSGGQQQAAAIARALANDPPFIIADEPTGNLDTRTAEGIFNLFTNLSDQGKTILMITHDPMLARRTSRQVLLSDGEVVNEWIHRALPMLPHTQMLKLTQNLRQHQFIPGTEIIQQGRPNESFYILTRGKVEIIVNGKKVDELLPGDYFGEIELMQDDLAVATVRAGESEPAEMVSFNRNLFKESVTNVESMYKTILQVAEVRLKANHRVGSVL